MGDFEKVKAERDAAQAIIAKLAEGWDMLHFSCDNPDHAEAYRLMADPILSQQVPMSQIEMKAVGWDEGYLWGTGDAQLAHQLGDQIPPRPNPYRTPNEESEPTA